MGTKIGDLSPTDDEPVASNFDYELSHCAGVPKSGCLDWLDEARSHRNLGIPKTVTGSSIPLDSFVCAPPKGARTNCRTTVAVPRPPSLCMPCAPRRPCATHDRVCTPSLPLCSRRSSSRCTLHLCLLPSSCLGEGAFMPRVCYHFLPIAPHHTRTWACIDALRACLSSCPNHARVPHGRACPIAYRIPLPSPAVSPSSGPCLPLPPALSAVAAEWGGVG